MTKIILYTILNEINIFSSSNKRSFMNSKKDLFYVVDTVVMINQLHLRKYMYEHIQNTLCY